MKVSLFSRFGYPPGAAPDGWPAPPRHFHPSHGQAALRDHLALVDLAVGRGFDMVTVAEHHYSHESLTPNPIVLASALSQRHADVRLLVLGPVLPLWDPVRLAEDVAMLDLLSGGRVSVGLFRGTLTELLAFGVPAGEARERAEEALELVLRAWTEDEPFAWHGRHYRRRIVAAWPRPVQRPSPPVYVAASSVDESRDVGRRGLRLGLLGQVTPPARAAELAAAYRDGAELAGRRPTAEDVLWRGRVHVAASDAAAERDRSAHRLDDAAPAAAVDGERGAVMRRILAAATPRSATRRDGGKGAPRGCELLGGPQTVARELAGLADEIGFGIADLAFSLPRLPLQKVRRSIELFVDDALPSLHRAY